MKRPPRVLLYSATPRADRGGVQRMMADLERTLPAAGHEVFRAGPDEPEASGLRFAPEVRADAVGRPAPGAIFAAVAALARLAALLRRVRPDVVNIHFPVGSTLYFLLLRRVYGYRLVLSAHGGDLLRPTPQMRAHLPRFLGDVDAVTVVSAELARTAERLAGPLGSLHNIPNGADTEFWVPDAAVSVVKGRLIGIGRLLPIKGFDLLIEAMAHLLEATAHLYGEGEARADLQSRIDAAGLSDRVVLKGHATPEVLRAALRAAEIFVMPSRGEGMPLALIEALATGTPAVAAEVGGIGDVLARPGAGLIVPPDDVEALVAALSKALSGEAGLSATAARTRAEEYSAAACYNSYATLLDDLAAGHRR